MSCFREHRVGSPDPCTEETTLLKDACVNRWNIAAEYIPTPKAGARHIAKLRHGRNRPITRFNIVLNQTDCPLPRNAGWLAPTKVTKHHRLSATSINATCRQIKGGGGDPCCLPSSPRGISTPTRVSGPPSRRATKWCRKQLPADLPIAPITARIASKVRGVPFGPEKAQSGFGQIRRPGKGHIIGNLD